jgi:hypothetical protein
VSLKLKILIKSISPKFTIKYITQITHKKCNSIPPLRFEDKWQIKWDKSNHIFFITCSFPKPDQFFLILTIFVIFFLLSQCDFYFFLSIPLNVMSHKIFQINLKLCEKKSFNNNIFISYFYLGGNMRNQLIFEGWDLKDYAGAARGFSIPNLMFSKKLIKLQDWLQYFRISHRQKIQT